MDHNKLWKILNRWEYQTTLCVCQDYILSPWLSNLYTEYILQIARMDEAQAGIKNSGRNINKLRYADDTTFMAESKELKPLDESERRE